MEKVVLATVGDIEITKDQMIGVLRNIPQEHAQSVAGEEGRIRLLDEMIAGELLYLDAAKKGYDQDEDFLTILEETKRGLLQRFAVNKLFDTIEITEEEITAHYDSNKAAYMKQEQAVASHILVDDEAKCETIKTEIADGKTFEDAAKEYSSCPSKENGGNLGPFGKGQMVKEFEDATFAATIGEVVGPVQTQFGYHLIRVESITPAEVSPLADVADQIKNILFQEKQAQVYHEQVDELKKEYPVKVNPEALK